MRIPQQAREEILHGEHLVCALELERIGARLYSLNRSNDPERAAAAIGISVTDWALPEETPSVLTASGDIRVRAGLNRQKRRLAIYHELAHVLLEWFVPLYTHADVWLLTVILLQPGELFMGLLRGANDNLTLAGALRILTTLEG